MAEYLQKITELQQLDPGLHWFCDRRNVTAHTNGHTQSEIEERKPLLEDLSTDVRITSAINCLRIFAWDGPEVAAAKEFLIGNIDKQLGKCDLCIVGYYKAKRGLLASLRDEYDDYEVGLFANIFDSRDITRIKGGLETAADTLRSLAPEQRGHAALEPSSLMSLFEAMSCERFLDNPEDVQQYFDEPFELVQTNGRLHVTRCVPAVTSFLFDPKQSRCLWALQFWSKYKTLLTKEDFDFAVRDPLSKVLATASGPITDLDFVSRLWCGMQLIVEKLDNELITHSLRAIEVDVFRVALEHLQFVTPGLRFLLQTIEKLLRKAPKDFWDSMGHISPTTIIEQIFNNQQYDTFMETANENEQYNFSALSNMLSWIQPFMSSLQTTQQPAACRALAFQLMERLQAGRFPSFTKIKCYHSGLNVISWTLNSCNAKKDVYDAVRRVSSAETLEAVRNYIKHILSIPSLSSTDEQLAVLVEPGLMVIKAALALECNALKMDQEALEHLNKLPDGFVTYSPTIWEAVVSSLDRGNLFVAKAALSGIVDLVGLEKITIKDNAEHKKEKITFNSVYGNVTLLVCQMLERIGDFSAEDLDMLYRSQETAVALISSLLSADSNTYEAGVELIKSISGEFGRKEAMAHLLQPFFSTTLESLSWSIRQIADKKTFGPCPRMLKTCTDVVDILCEPQDGLLRSRQLSDLVETEAIQRFWETQWEALKVIYETTESWHMRIGDSAAMKTFCRDTMQFSDHFFGQYSVFASSIDSAPKIKHENDGSDMINEKAGKSLLMNPAQTMAAMVKWLRLKDEYLATTSVNLVTKVLNRLSEWQMTLPKSASSYLEDVVSSKTKTILTPQEKAELARALEANLGRNISTVTGLTPSDNDSSDQKSLNSRRIIEGARKTKPGTIDLEDWSRKAAQARQGDKSGISGKASDDILSASSSVERLKLQQANRNKSPKPALPAPSQHSLSKLAGDRHLFRGSKAEVLPQVDMAAFREKRSKETEAKRRRDAEALAKARSRIHPNKQGSGEGSALNGLGIQGKDHAPRASGMMVSSGSEDESDSELDAELFGASTKAVKVSATVKAYQENKLKQLHPQRPVKKIRQERSEKHLRARLAPNLSPLHQSILSWEYFHTGDFPPNSGRSDYSLVTNSFRTPKEYQQTFEALLLLEAWQSLLKSKEEGNNKPFEIQITGRTSVDSFVEFDTTIDVAAGKELSIRESDIVLLSKASSPISDPTQVHCLARVHRINRKKNIVISYRVNGNNPLGAAIAPKAVLYGVKVDSITPLEREYGALHGLEYYDLCDEIIRGQPSPLLEYSERQIQPLINSYKLNAAQAKAVQSAVDNDAFTLIQGPPGSGKTKTIVAIVGALLTNNMREKGVTINRPQNTGGGGNPPKSAPMPKKLLVCAPSNAAVDELVMRFKQGVKTLDGVTHDLKVVRLGRSEAINTNVIDVTLEELVNVRLNLSDKKNAPTGTSLQDLYAKHKATSEKLQERRQTKDELGSLAPVELNRDIEYLKRQRQQLSNQIDMTRDSGNTAARDADIHRRKIEQEILEDSHVICSTLSGSGHTMFQNLSIEFETVIIDEAAQSIELSALIPLKYGCAKCIMVGDPQQLPPTVLSREAARFQYEQSLFVRMQKNHPNFVHLLDTQYRMHPEISIFPSQTFYDGRLLDGPGMAGLRKKPWHETEILGPYRFFNVEGTQATASRSHSYVNVAEIDFAMQLFNRIVTDYQGYDFAGKIGMISPYKGQVKELKSRFARQYGEDIFNTIDFNTTDAFQGRESDIIIISCVRASPTGGVGFLDDIRRMNVAITRAKSSLWVIGNAKSLVQGDYWRKMIIDAKSRNVFTGNNVWELLQKPLLTEAKANGPGSTSSDSPTSDSQFDGVVSLSKPDSDTEMLEAPPLRAQDNLKDSVKKQAASEPAVQRQATTAQSGVSPTILDNAGYFPSGGGNGLNSSEVCGICGSFEHFFWMCSDTEAKRKTNGECLRCHDVHHATIRCPLEMCCDCGAFGHSQKQCTSQTLLSKEAKELYKRREAQFQRDARRHLERQKQRQVGDHDKTVPLVKVTRKTPPRAQASDMIMEGTLNTEDRKRRAPSPVNAPKGPKAPRRMPNDGPPSGPKAMRPALPPDNVKRPMPHIYPDTNNQHDDPRRRSIGNIEKQKMGERLISNPRGGNGKLSTEPPGPDGEKLTSRASMPVVRNPVPPPRKKKINTEPFIIPKKKKPHGN